MIFLTIFDDWSQYFIYKTSYLTTWLLQLQDESFVFSKNQKGPAQSTNILDL